MVCQRPKPRYSEQMSKAEIILDDRDIGQFLHNLTKQDILKG